MVTSRFLSVGAKDWLNGLFATVAGAVFAIVAPTLTAVVQDPVNAKLVFDFTAIWHTAVATGVLYIGNAFFSKAKHVKPVE